MMHFFFLYISKMILAFCKTPMYFCFQPKRECSMTKEFQELPAYYQPVGYICAREHASTLDLILRKNMLPVCMAP